MAEALDFLARFTDWERQQIPARHQPVFELRRVLALSDAAGAPHRRGLAVHVTGTKGKGSTAAMIAAILGAHGLRTGLFLSPHLERINERIAVDGIAVSDDRFAALLEGLRPEILRVLASDPPATPSFFEIVTVMALAEFAARGVDAPVVEVGLGGRLDATNILERSVAVITTIGLDHTRVLGRTASAIAREKAGILKPGGIAVTGLAPGEPGFAEIEARARETGTMLLARERDFSIGILGEERVGDRFETRFRLRGGVFHDAGFVISLPGEAQARNAATAIVAAAAFLRARGVAPDAGRTAGALAEFRMPGRTELIRGQDGCLALLDTAHNTSSFAHLAAVLRRHFPAVPVVALLGMASDKRVESAVRQLRGLLRHVVATTLPSPRSLPAADLGARVARALPGCGAAAATDVEPDPERALHRARTLLSPDGLLLVTGSFYLAGALRRRLLPAEATG